MKRNTKMFCANKPSNNSFHSRSIQMEVLFLISIFCKQSQQQLLKAGCKLNTVVTDPLNSVILNFPLTAGKYIGCALYTHVGRSCTVLPCAFRLSFTVCTILCLSFIQAFLSVSGFYFHFIRNFFLNSSPIYFFQV